MRGEKKEHWVGFEYSVGHLDGLPTVLRRGGHITIDKTINDMSWQRYLESTPMSIADMRDIRIVVELLNERAEKQQAEYVASQEARAAREAANGGQ